MSSAWRVQSGRDHIGTLRTSPHQIVQTCACLSAARNIGQPQSIVPTNAPGYGGTGPAHRPERPPVAPVRHPK
jgi:hypothetical protein